MPLSDDIIIADHNLFMYPLPYNSIQLFHSINNTTTMFSFYMHAISHKICLFSQRNGMREKTGRKESGNVTSCIQNLHSSKKKCLKTSNMGEEALNHQPCSEVFEDDFFEHYFSQRLKVVSRRNMMQRR